MVGSGVADDDGRGDAVCELDEYGGCRAEEAATQARAAAAAYETAFTLTVPRR